MSIIRAPNIHFGKIPNGHMLKINILLNITNITRRKIQNIVFQTLDERQHETMIWLLPSHNTRRGQPHRIAVSRHTETEIRAWESQVGARICRARALEEELKKNENLRNVQMWCPTVPG